MVRGSRLMVWCGGWLLGLMGAKWEPSKGRKYPRGGSYRGNVQEFRVVVDWVGPRDRSRAVSKAKTTFQGASLF